jgi:hypothetical protein
MVKTLYKSLALLALFAISACSAGSTNSSLPNASSITTPDQTTAASRTALGAKPNAKPPKTMPDGPKGPKPPPEPKAPKPDGSVVYDSIPNQLHGIASFPFQAAQANEFGDGVNLTSTGALDTVSVVMDSWGCQNGAWFSNDCATTPGSTFNVPITLHVYAVTGATGVGALLASQTKTFAIPFRPSADPAHCTGANAGKFFSAVDQAFYGGFQGGCDNGFVNLIVFDDITAAPSAPANLPAQVIVTVAFNTSNYGYNPIGTAPCQSTSAGCGYDSLNVGSDGNGGPVGSVLDPNGIFVSYQLTSNYCDGGTNGQTTLRLDSSPTSCGWAGFHPQIQVTIDKHDKDDKPGKPPKPNKDND